jgi:hypothetical protein
VPARKTVRPRERAGLFAAGFGLLISGRRHHLRHAKRLRRAPHKASEFWLETLKPSRRVAG